MIGLAIAAAAIAAILLLRVGAEAEYSDAGVSVRARVGFLRITVFPRKSKLKKSEKKRSKKAPKKAKKKTPKKTAEKKPGPAYDFRELIGGAASLLGKARRKLLIKRLTVWYVQGGGDAFSMAMAHGGISAAFGMTQAALESAFKVRRYDLHTSVDFLAEEPRVYVRAIFSIAIWETISLGISALALLLRSKKTATRPQEVKGE